MNQPFEIPTNRAEARDNAIHCLNISQVDRSLAWAAIAEVFSPDHPVEAPFGWNPPVTPPSNPGYEPGWAEKVIEDLDDTAVIGVPIGAGSTAVVTTSGHTVPGTPITVDAAAWDVLRALAIRYVLSSIDNRPVAVHFNDPETQQPVWDLKFSMMPDSGVAHCWVEAVS